MSAFERLATSAIANARSTPPSQPAQHSPRHATVSTSSRERFTIPSPVQPVLRAPSVSVQRCDDVAASPSAHGAFADVAPPHLSPTQDIRSAAALFASPTLRSLSGGARRGLAPLAGRDSPMSLHNANGDAGSVGSAVVPRRLTTTAAASAAWSQPVVDPQGPSVFYPLGLEAQPPLLLHYIQLGHWRTVAAGRDYFNQRRLANRDVIGHTVRWLHNARPRDRFVFIIEPVEERPAEQEHVDDESSNEVAREEDKRGQEEIESSSAVPPANGKSSHATSVVKRRGKARKGLWARLQRALFGPAPAFAYKRGKLAKEANAWIALYPEDGDAADDDERETMEEAESSVVADGTARSLSVMSPVTLPNWSFPRVCASPTPEATIRSPVRASSSLGDSPDRPAQPSHGGLLWSPTTTFSQTAPVTMLSSSGPTAAWDARDGRLTHALIGSPVAIAPRMPQSRRNKAIRRMLVAQLFGHDGPAMRDVRSGTTRASTVSLEPVRRTASDLVSPVEERQQQHNGHGRAAPTASVPERVLSCTPSTGETEGEEGEKEESVSVVSVGSSLSCSSTASAPVHGATPWMRDDRRAPDHRSPREMVRSSSLALAQHPSSSRHHHPYHQRSQSEGDVQRMDAGARRHRPSHSPSTRGSAVLTFAKQHIPFLGKQGGGASPTSALPTPSSSPPVVPPPAGPRRGVEVIEIAHVDVTALDYAPHLLSSRFSIETRTASTYFFPSTAAACCHYGCPEAAEQIQAQIRMGVSAHIPQSTTTTTTASTAATVAGRQPDGDMPGSGTRRESHRSLGVAASGTARASHRAQSGSGSRGHASIIRNGCEPDHAQDEADEDAASGGADGETLWSIASALKKGVLPPPRASHASRHPQQQVPLDGLPPRFVSRSRSRSSSSGPAGSSISLDLRSRSQTAAPPPPPAPSGRLSSIPTASTGSVARVTSGSRDNSDRRPPSLFPTTDAAGQPESAAVAARLLLSPCDGIPTALNPGLKTPRRRSLRRGAGSEGEAEEEEEDALDRSPSVMPPPSSAPARSTASPVNLARSFTKVFNEARRHAPGQTLPSLPSTVTTHPNNNNNNAEEGETDPMRRSLHPAAALGTGVPSPTLLPLPLAPPSRREDSDTNGVFDWRTLDVDAAPLPCFGATTAALTAFPPPPQRVLMSTHQDVIVSIYTADPHFNAALRELLMPESGTHPYTASTRQQQRLLSMYESGMPAWCIFVGSMSLVQYRRAYRIVYIGLINLWPIVSLGVGVYDLYRHLPKMKRFMSHTIEPLVRRIEAHFTLRVSVWVTYLLSVVLTIFASLSAFVSQFYVVRVLSPVVRLVVMVVKLPCFVVVESVWSSLSIVASFIGLAWMTVKVLALGPFLLVLQVAGWFGATNNAATTVVRGSSLAMRWWVAWQEFWITVASPIKNLAKAWWDSMLHVTLSVARREASLRRWYTSRMAQLLGTSAVWLERGLAATEAAADVVVVNAGMWWGERGWCRPFTHVPALVQLLWLVVTGLLLLHVLRTLSAEHSRAHPPPSPFGSRRPYWWASDYNRVSRAVSPQSLDVCGVIPHTRPPLPLPASLEWFWDFGLHVAQLSFVALVQRVPAGWQTALCAMSWLPNDVRHAASPPCVVAEMSLTSAPPMCAVYSLPPASHGADAQRTSDSDVVGEEAPYVLPFDRYPILVLTDDASYVWDVLYRHPRGTTRVEYRLHFDD